VIPGLASEIEVRGLLLAPGAGAGSDQPGLVAIDRALSALGVEVERMDFPYRLAGRRRPDAPVTLEASVRARALALAARIGVATSRLALGGRSMGGRICSQVVAGGLPAAGLVLVSYPLHPPGRGDRPRTAHLGQLRVPCLLVSGTRDPFATPEELLAAFGRVGAPVAHEWIEGADHGLRGHDAEVARIVADWIARHLASR
jgi:predicted alpha/beta-hydrolase family hydrolase